MPSAYGSAGNRYPSLRTFLLCTCILGVIWAPLLFGEALAGAPMCRPPARQPLCEVAPHCEAQGGLYSGHEAGRVFGPRQSDSGTLV